MSNTNQRSEMTLQEVLAHEDLVSREKFYQKIDHDLEICHICKFYNRRSLKKESDMNESEKILYKRLLEFGYQEPERRVMIPFKSPIGIWTYLCLNCSKTKPKGWE